MYSVVHSEAPELSTEYQAAIEAHNAAQRAYGLVRDAYRNREIDDMAYLAARRLWVAADAQFDLAFMTEQARLDGKAAPEGALTVKLNCGWTVLAKIYKGKPSAVTYSNRSQAASKVAQLGAGWHVMQHGRPFYVRKIEAAAAS